MKSSASLRSRCSGVPTTWRYAGSRTGAARYILIEPLAVKLLQPLDHRSALVTDHPAVDGADWSDAREGSGRERLVRAIDVGQREVTLERRNACVARNFQHQP